MADRTLKDDVALVERVAGVKVTVVRPTYGPSHLALLAPADGDAELELYAAQRSRPAARLPRDDPAWTTLVRLCLELHAARERLAAVERALVEASRG